MQSTILCIDDHAGTLQTISLLLQFAGYRCLSAATADEAKSLFAENRVDLVIVDHGLPGLPGDKLAEELKQIKHVRIIMLTGDTSIEKAPSSIDVLLHKPYPPEDFLKAVSSLTSIRSVAAVS